MRRPSRFHLAAMGLALGCAALAGCDDANMYAQGKYSTWDKSTFFPKKMSMQLPVEGTVPRDEPNQPAPAPATITRALVERGQERYDIFCTPCHGLTGKGDGMIVQRGFPHPPALDSERLIKAKSQYFYDVIANGHGTMYSYADRVPPADRWAIAAYIRALQTSQRPDVAALPPDDQSKLGGQP